MHYAKYDRIELKALTRRNCTVPLQTLALRATGWVGRLAGSKRILDPLPSACTVAAGAGAPLLAPTGRRYALIQLPQRIDRAAQAQSPSRHVTGHTGGLAGVAPGCDARCADSPASTAADSAGKTGSIGSRHARQECRLRSILLRFPGELATLRIRRGWLGGDLDRADRLRRCRARRLLEAVDAVRETAVQRLRVSGSADAQQGRQQDAPHDRLHSVER